MFRLRIHLVCSFFITAYAFGQSPSFETYINPVIPGDHPDPTLTKIGQDFYTSGSSFNPTPKIYHSTDLVHWEVIAQPVAASWSQYGDSPGGGIWGGHIVLYNGKYWHYFGKGGGSMYFVTADQPRGPWSNPTRVNVPSGMAGLGVDNSIFIDEETGKWYLLTKAGEPNNHIVELGTDGQPTGFVLDLTWLNPGPAPYPYGWAEGPVMWKYKGYYYYSFAQHLSGAQYVMRSDTLTDDRSAWTIIGQTIFTGTRGTFGTPNHISPVVMLDDSTSWTIAHSNNGSNWHAQGRQGLLCQVTYNDQGFPVIPYPSTNAVQAPDLPGNGIPWAVPRTDTFNETTLNPSWSFLGYTPDRTWSLTDREGWLYLEPYQGTNTIIQNDGEHDYSMITRLDFEPKSSSDEAGLRIINGPETHYVKVFSTVNDEYKSVFALSFQNIRYEAENRIGSVMWLKLVRNEHMISGYYSADGIIWVQIGEAINAQILDTEKPNYNKFTGNQQGLYVEGEPAYFDLYIYKDAYSPIIADSPTDQFGITRKYTREEGYVLGNISVNDWAMYAGLEFGNEDYIKSPDRIRIFAGSEVTGGHVEVWLDSIDTGDKIAGCDIGNTGDIGVFQIFTADVKPVSGQHDVYLKFTGSGTGDLFQIHSFYFLTEGDTVTAVPGTDHSIQPRTFGMKPNYPNPFNSETVIPYTVTQAYQRIRIAIFNLKGERICTLLDNEKPAGSHLIRWDGKNEKGQDTVSGLYMIEMQSGDHRERQKIVRLN
jgi:xylan 1,4-beta-xylosidase